MCFGFVTVLTKELPASKAQMFSIERDVQAEIYLVFRFVQNIKSVFFLLLCVKKILFLFAPQILLTGCFLVDIDMIAIVLCTPSLFFSIRILYTSQRNSFFFLFGIHHNVCYFRGCVCKRNFMVTFPLTALFMLTGNKYCIQSCRSEK